MAMSTCGWEASGGQSSAESVNYLLSVIRTVKTSVLRQPSPDFYRPIIERVKMRSVCLGIILMVGLSTAAFGQQLKAITNSIGMKLVLIHAGSFTMGVPVNEIEMFPNETQHEVTLSKSYYLGVLVATLVGR